MLITIVNIETIAVKIPTILILILICDPSKISQLFHLLKQ